MRLRLLLLCAFAALPCSGASSLWTNIGPDGGEARSLAVDERNGTTFVLNGRSGVYRKSSSGPWMLVFDAIAHGVSPTQVTVDAQTSRVYVGTTTGLWRSDDQGKSWLTLSSDPVIHVAAGGDRVIVSAPLTLSRSGDAGVTWRLIEPPPSASRAAVSLIRIDPRASERAVAVIDGNLFSSDDFGNSWQPLTPKNVVAVFFGDSLYAGGSDGVYQCDTTCSRIGTDAVIDVAQWRIDIYGATSGGVLLYSSPRWIRLADGFPPAAVLSLAAPPAALLASTAEGVVRSDDGARWTDLSDGLTNVRISAITRTSKAILASTRHEGIMTRTGESWTTAGPGLPSHPPNDPVARAMVADGATVYAAFPDDGLFRSTNDGVSWNDISAGLPSRFVHDVAAGAGVVLAATASGLTRSSDRGASWHLMAGYPARSATAVAVHGSMIVAAESTTAFVSTDGGATWQASDLPGVVRSLAIAGDRLAAATDQGIFVRSGGAWIGPTLTTVRPKAMVAAGTRLYAAAASPGIYFTDDGTTWLLVPESETLPPDITALFTDDELLYAGTDGGSIFAALRAPRRRTVRR